MKTCTKCKETKAESEFYPDRSKKIGLSAKCKRCNYELANAWRRNHPNHNRDRYWNNQYRALSALVRQHVGIAAVHRSRPTPRTGQWARNRHTHMTEPKIDPMTIRETNEQMAKLSTIGKWVE